MIEALAANLIDSRGTGLENLASFRRKVIQIADLNQ